MQQFYFNSDRSYIIKQRCLQKMVDSSSGIICRMWLMSVLVFSIWSFTVVLIICLLLQKIQYFWFIFFKMMSPLQVKRSTFGSPPSDKVLSLSLFLWNHFQLLKLFFQYSAMLYESLSTISTEFSSVKLWGSIVLSEWKKFHSFWLKKNFCLLSQV